jgi:hypothetical protein
MEVHPEGAQSSHTAAEAMIPHPYWMGSDTGASRPRRDRDRDHDRDCGRFGRIH